MLAIHPFTMINTGLSWLLYLLLIFMALTMVMGAVRSKRRMPRRRREELAAVESGAKNEIRGGGGKIRKPRKASRK